MCLTMDKKYDLSSIILICLILCFSQVQAMGALSPQDPSSFSRPELALMKHVSLKLDVDFKNKVLSGVATIDFEVFEETAELVLDVSNLTIESIALDDGAQIQYKQDKPVKNFGSKLTITLPKSVSRGDKKDAWTTNKEDKACDVLKFTGFAYAAVPRSSKCIGPNKTINSNDDLKDTVDKMMLANFYVKIEDSETSEDSMASTKSKCSKTIESKIIKTSETNHKLDKSCICCLCKEQSGNECARLKIRIKYTTSPTASALQWLDPQQTSGKKHPYLFSQCQPIHARSILPCQDSPAVKFTYDAEVTAPQEFTVLMSALRGETRNNKTSFRQPVPLPAYLVAIAVGVLESKSLGPRSLVWSEKEEIERSAWEFAETEKYLQAAEKLCGPYVWTQYDLLVLPPSFPYGGMENPCLTFVTPTLLAGDRSQADVIVHEIMHSWTGNLVTNNNFEHFWLNEGFTVFLERKVGASLISNAEEAKKSRDFHSLLGLQELTETVNDQLGESNPLTKLVVDLNGVNPDDAFSTVPYEKGSLFLVYLENLLGGPEVFDVFLRAYLKNFQRKSLNTDQFKAYLLNYFKDNDKLAAVNWESWLYSTGMPPIIPDYDTSMTKAISSLLAKIKLDNSILAYDDVRSFTPHQMINLLQELVQGQALPLDKLKVLGAEYKVNTSKNTEILYRWLRLCIRSKYMDKLDEVFSFVNGQGRMKYVRPIYRDLYAWEEVRQRAIDNFLKNESSMMHVSAYTLRKDLHLSE